ncbi:glycosyltransferase family 4 protein [Pseudanabaena sp. ABRG5-3]|uniref:glycosyltransferase family 4 protein n=1 Tax=Pseudanabaena sp. ABRG5-3 TaxID=685565 RepID=UPI000DC731CD|nr:glycosyltransferase family 4 protein [Pseudanabaena sp. ABRG5-3]BBC24675.1 glycosyl transferase group 1 [Pseudanabaena sp. ABRG5-3]
MFSQRRQINLAIIASHPIQYYAPLFQGIAHESDLKIKVFYLWDFGITNQIDRGFQQSLKWDISLLDGYEFEFVPNTSKAKGTHHIFGLQNPTLTKQVLEFNPDAILLTVSYNYISIYRLLWQLRNHNIPIIFRGDSHRILAKQDLKSKIKRLFISWIFQNFAACLYVGKANYDYFRYHHIPENKLFFAPHAIDKQRFSDVNINLQEKVKIWKRELGIPLDNQVILFAGKFEEKKRPLDLIQAFIHAQLPSVSLLLVGSGVLESAMRDLAQQNQHIYFAPFQNQSLMPLTYAMGDVLVLPSYGASETWGLAINEAMCMGNPVIVSNHVGCAADLVKPFENGLIFDAGNVDALTDCLREAMGDRDRLKRWGEESKKIIANYSYEHVIAGLKQALQSVLK